MSISSAYIHNFPNTLVPQTSSIVGSLYPFYITLLVIHTQKHITLNWSTPEKTSNNKNQYHSSLMLYQPRYLGTIEINSC